MAEVRAVAGAASAVFTAHVTLTVRATVEAVAEAIHPRPVRHSPISRRSRPCSTGPSEPLLLPSGSPDRWRLRFPFGPVGRFIRANGELITLIALVVAVIALLQDRANNSRVDPPPSVTVQVEPPDRTEVERIVEEKLRELSGPVEKPGD